MIEGIVTEDDVPEIRMPIGNREFRAVIDTGFNGFLELPENLKPDLRLRDAGIIESLLAADQVIYEQGYLVNVEFDDQTIEAVVTFSESEAILLGTNMLRQHRLEIDFPAKKLWIHRISTDD